MILASTRLGANATPLPEPAPLTSLSAVLSRRAAMFGAVTVAGASTAFAAYATNSLGGRLAAQSTALSPADARLIALADAYEALDREVNATHSTAPGYEALVDRYQPIEDALAGTPADGLPGLAAKARALQIRSLRDAGYGDVPLSLADDVHRLLGMEAVS